MDFEQIDEKALIALMDEHTKIIEKRRPGLLKKISKICEVAEEKGAGFNVYRAVAIKATDGGEVLFAYPEMGAEAVVIGIKGDQLGGVVFDDDDTALIRELSESSEFVYEIGGE